MESKAALASRTSSSWNVNSHKQPARTHQMDQAAAAVEHSNILLPRLGLITHEPPPPTPLAAATGAAQPASQQLSAAVSTTLKGVEQTLKGVEQTLKGVEETILTPAAAAAAAAAPPPPALLTSSTSFLRRKGRCVVNTNCSLNTAAPPGRSRTGLLSTHWC
jgi:hypothetical protein